MESKIEKLARDRERNWHEIDRMVRRERETKNGKRDQKDRNDARGMIG